VDNPAQRGLPLPDPNFHSSYVDGFESGVNWDASWMPGGPWVYTCHGWNPKPEHKAMAFESQQRHDLWMQGFRDGLEILLRTNDHFAAWWDKHRKMAGHHRYTAPCSEWPRAA
jgi:hypothetical protein